MSNRNDADVNVRIGFVHVTLAIHDVFFAVTPLEKVKRVTEILFASVTVELKHKVDGSGNDDVFDTDGIRTWTFFQMKLSDTLLNDLSGRALSLQCNSSDESETGRCWDWS